jgi:membrane protease subunit HflK
MSKNNRPGKSYTIIILAVLLIYFLTGIYTTESGQHALITRFGRVVRITTDPGINYSLPYPFERVRKTRVHQVKKVLLQDSRGMGIESFTGDENLILIKSVISFDIKDLVKYHFNISDPEATVESAGRLCFNEEIARRSVDDLMTTGKSVFRLVLKDKIQELLDELDTGIRVISVELTDITPPQDVSESFKAVSNAREEKQKIIKEAEGYANTVIPKARGQVSSILSEAQAYKEEVIDLATARTRAFSALYAEYLKKPSNTSKLRYLETIKKIYEQCKVMVDSDPSQSTYYIGKAGKIGISDSTGLQKQSNQ